MKIIHVVALVSSSGEYGGPTRVCFDQAQELKQRGHDVTVFAGTWGPIGPETVKRRLFRARLLVPRLGFATLHARGLTQALVMAARGADVVHIHLGRDLLTLGAARAVRKAGVPYVVQTHGMIDSSARLSAAVIDRVLTGPAIRAASDVFTLTTAEDDEMRRLGRTGRPSRFLRNGIPADDSPREATAYETLFLARLHPRKGLQAYVEACIDLARARPGTQYAFAGPDEGALTEALALVRAAGLEKQIRYLGPIEPHRVRAVMGQAKVYCLPAREEPFGMTLLEAMSVGTPVVLHESSRLADRVAGSGAGVAFGGGVGLADAIAQLADDEERNTEARREARRLVSEDFGMGGVVAELEDAYSWARLHRRWG